MFVIIDAETNDEDRIAVTLRFGTFPTSMLVDAEQGRPIEIDPIIAVPQEIGRLAGAPRAGLDTLPGIMRLYARISGFC